MECQALYFYLLIQQQQPNMYLTIILIPLFFFFALYFYITLLLSKAQSRNRITNYRNRSNQKIQSNKMIIAIQLIDIFVTISQTSTPGFVELEVERKGIKKYLHCLLRLVGKDVVYYRIREKQDNIDFIQKLRSTGKVQLYLYTNQTQIVTNALLKKLGLCKYFNEGHRRYRDQNKEKKHPTQIDSETRRVIILTSSRDYASEDSKYFLIMKRKNLRKYGRELSELIRKNEDIDDLHTEFVAWKMGHCGYDSSQQ